MKLKELIITAFGPYKESEYIDFSKFEEGGLFLLTGPTGSGKTAIFDAIIFALYGDSSTGDRANETLRSQWASSDLLTEVAFTFELRGKTYKIIRSPRQERPKARGTGMTEHKGEASLIFLDEKTKPYVGTKAVNDYITTLLGLSANQFKQLIMIPQGAFREFLISDSKAKEDILVHLFDVLDFDEITDKAKKRAEIVKSSLEKTENKLASVSDNVKDLDFTEISEYLNEDVVDYAKIVTLLKQKLPVLKNEQESLKTSLSKAQENMKHIVRDIEHKKAINQEIDKYNKCQQRHQFLCQQETAIKELEKLVDDHVKAVPLTKLLQTIAKLEQRIKDEMMACNLSEVAIKELSADVEKYHKEVEQLESEEEKHKIKKQAEQIEELKKQLEQRNIYRQLQHKQKLLKENKEITAEALKNATEKVDQLSAVKEKREQNEKTISEHTKKRHSLESSLSQVEQEVLRLEHLAKTSDDLEDKRATLHQLQSKSEVYEQKFIQDKRQYLFAKQQYHLNQAYLLAQELQTNEPCMVCGSLTHPSPANQTNDMTKEKLSDYE